MGPSRDLQESLSPLLALRDEHGVELFYNFEVTPWLTVGADLQVINPSLGEDMVVIPGLRSVTRF
jgi:porin